MREVEEACTRSRTGRDADYVGDGARERGSDALHVTVLFRPFLRAQH